MTSNIEEKDGKSVMGVVKLRQSYMPVNFHLRAISGNKTAETCCSSANEGLFFPGLLLKPLMVSFTLQCTAYFRCTLASPAPGVQDLPGLGVFQTQVLRTVGSHY